MLILAALVTPSGASSRPHEEQITTRSRADFSIKMLAPDRPTRRRSPMSRRRERNANENEHGEFVARTRSRTIVGFGSNC